MPPKSTRYSIRLCFVSPFNEVNAWKLKDKIMFQGIIMNWLFFQDHRHHDGDADNFASMMKLSWKYLLIIIGIGSLSWPTTFHTQQFPTKNLSLSAHFCFSQYQSGRLSQSLLYLKQRELLASCVKEKVNNEWAAHLHHGLRQRTKKPDTPWCQSEGYLGGCERGQRVSKRFQGDLISPSVSPCVWLGIVHDFKSHREG